MQTIATLSSLAIILALSFWCLTVLVRGVDEVVQRLEQEEID